MSLPRNNEKLFLAITSVLVWERKKLKIALHLFRPCENILRFFIGNICGNLLRAHAAAMSLPQNNEKLFLAMTNVLASYKKTPSLPSLRGGAKRQSPPCFIFRFPIFKEKKMFKGGYVYIITNAYNAILYTGVTSELRNRIWEHKTNYYPNSFSSKYKCYKLVFYVFFESIDEAIAEEKRIKACKRQSKINLINNSNPQWNDLYDLIEE